jgi:hypothetical protein
LLAYSHLSLPLLPNQRIFITFIRKPLESPSFLCRVSAEMRPVLIAVIATRDNYCWFGAFGSSLELERSATSRRITQWMSRSNHTFPFSSQGLSHRPTRDRASRAAQIFCQHRLFQHIAMLPLNLRPEHYMFPLTPLATAMSAPCSWKTTLANSALLTHGASNDEQMYIDSPCSPVRRGSSRSVRIYRV